MGDTKQPSAHTEPQFNREELPYREGAIGIVVDSQGRFLVVQTNVYKENEWRFPGGGVDRMETHEQALLREFQEELGTDKFEIVKKSSQVNQYDWPDGAILERYNRKGEWHRGQRQHQFLVRFTGQEENIKPDSSEIRAVKWIKREELSQFFVFPNQWKQAEPVINELLS